MLMTPQTPKQFKWLAGMHYLVLVEVDQIKERAQFSIDRSDYGNMDDWLPVGPIDSAKAS